MVKVDFAAFLGVSVLVIASPGQDTALTIRNTLAGGRSVGHATAAGVASGQAVWTLAASAGVASVLIASDGAFLVLKLVGAGYLIFLGAEALLHVLQRGEGDAAAPAQPSVPLRPARAFRQGFISNLGNPKMAVFFASLLPQFVSDGGSFATLMVLGLAFCALTLAWLAAYAAVVARAGDTLRRPRVRRALEGVLGTALIALGARLATLQR